MVTLLPVVFIGTLANLLVTFLLLCQIPERKQLKGERLGCGLQFEEIQPLLAGKTGKTECQGWRWLVTLYQQSQMEGRREGVREGEKERESGSLLSHFILFYLVPELS